jgi:N-acetylgalactosamine-N,N'-diacetylbacillosaminyl-diphospho-undecaprenol 4-alpha-N-acetylgalactosaminyltransferase
MRRRVLCVINSLAGGGAERMFARLLEAFVNRAPGLAFDVALLDCEPRAYTLPRGLAVTEFDARRSMARSAAALSAHVLKRKPDVLFSFLTRANCAAIVAGKFGRRPVVISERTFTSAHFSGRPLQKALVRTLYPKATQIIAVGDASRRDLIQNFAVSCDRVRVIHNPVASASIRAQASAYASPFARAYVAAMGRLAPSKNFALLIEAFARAGLDEDLVILGEGPERGALQSQIDARGLNGRVRLVGRLDNPFPILAGAQCLVVSSNVEGFPNVIVEALTLGVPVVSTDCDCGPAELLGGDAARKVGEPSWAPYGLLAPPNDAEALAAALVAMSDPQRRRHYAQRGPERAAMFAPDRSADLYLAAIAQVLGAPSRPISRLEAAA